MEERGGRWTVREEEEEVNEWRREEEEGGRRAGERGGGGGRWTEAGEREEAAAARAAGTGTTCSPRGAGAAGEGGREAGRGGRGAGGGACALGDANQSINFKLCPRAPPPSGGRPPQSARDRGGSGRSREHRAPASTGRAPGGAASGLPSSPRPARPLPSAPTPATIREGKAASPSPVAAAESADMSFPQLGYPQYLSAAGPGAYGGERPGVLAAAAAAAAAASSGRPGAAAELGAGAAAVTSVLGMYAAAGPYAGAPNYSAFLPYAADLSLFSQMGSQYELKDNPGVHPATFATHTPPAYYPYGQFQYGDPGRPKNATRESTSTLKAWLNEHRKNPYPTKGEKIMLAIITKMTLTQVSTWFANARRRLKKENKVTWGARSKDQEDCALFGSDTEGDPEKAEDDEEIDLESIDIDKIDEHEGDQSNEEDEDKAEAPRGPAAAPTSLARDPNSPLSAAARALKSQDSPLGMAKEVSEPGSTRLLSPGGGGGGVAPGGLQGAPHSSKPKIWSLAETATSPDGASKASPPPPPPQQPQPQPAAAGHAGAHGPPTATPLQHPAFLPSHGLYTCHIGKFSNWTNGAFLTQGSLLNMRSFLGVGAPHAAPHGPHLSAPLPPQPPVPVATGVIHVDKASARSSPALPERDLVPRPDSPPQQLKSPFQPVRDNSLAPQEGTPRILAALPSA